MRENEFRDRLRDALGEPPHLPDPQLTPSDAGVSRGYPRGMALIAVGLAIVLVVALVASRVALRPTGMTQPGAKGGVAMPADAFPCSLAVTMFSYGSSPGQDPLIDSKAGFLNIPSGEFRLDPSANFTGLPSMPYNGPSYSPALQRWIPASARMISPDGRSYVYQKWLPEGATSPRDANGTELRVYDVDKQADRLVWRQQSAVTLIRWDTTGILVDNMPFRGGQVTTWRIDPATGHASEESVDRDPSTPLWIRAYLQTQKYGFLFSDGHVAVYRQGSRDQGTRYSVVVVSSGKISTLYEGVMGDKKDFDPGDYRSDAHGLWMGNVDGAHVWLWNESSGLRDFKVTNRPTPAAGYQFSSVSFQPAGPCIPGVFSGPAPAPLPPAPTPRPSPSPPQVDWAPLIAKPLNLQQLSSGARCPVSPQVDLTVTTNGPKKGGPNYGFGQGPVYVSGQTNWYAGTQAILFLTNPKYTGPVLVRTMRLDGNGSLTLSGDGATTLDGGAIGLAQTSSPPYWGMWIGMLTPRAPGCYGIQFDGTSFSAISVITVLPGPVRPG